MRLYLAAACKPAALCICTERETARAVLPAAAFVDRWYLTLTSSKPVFNERKKRSAFYSYVQYNQYWVINLNRKLTVLIQKDMKSTEVDCARLCTSARGWGLIQEVQNEFLRIVSCTRPPGRQIGWS